MRIHVTRALALVVLGVLPNPSCYIPSGGNPGYSGGNPGFAPMMTGDNSSVQPSTEPPVADPAVVCDTLTLSNMRVGCSNVASTRMYTVADLDACNRRVLSEEKLACMQTSGWARWSGINSDFTTGGGRGDQGGWNGGHLLGPGRYVFTLSGPGSGAVYVVTNEPEDSNSGRNPSRSVFDYRARTGESFVLNLAQPSRIRYAILSESPVDVIVHLDAQQQR